MPKFYHDLATDKIVTEEYYKANPFRFSIIPFDLEPFESLQEAQEALDGKYSYLKADPNWKGEKI